MNRGGDFDFTDWSYHVLGAIDYWHGLFNVDYLVSFNAQQVLKDFGDKVG